MTQDSANVAQLPEFDEIVDVRSPAEFALDHVPGAINCPVLDDAERERVGTMYTQDSPFKAKKLGAALVARNIARHVETHFADKPKQWKPLIYCWRGGQRSGAMNIVLRQIGWDARRLAGGYKAYRRHVVEDIDRMAPELMLRVVCGPTGSGKSALLRALKKIDVQVLDLEALAAHRGSVLGELPGAPQPTQKMFESLLWSELSALNAGAPVFVEAESKKIGNLRVPQTLIERMWASDCVRVETGIDMRVELLLREYAHFVSDTADLDARLDCLVAINGHERIAGWKSLAAANDWHAFVRELLENHYDPAYRKSTLAHYPQLANAVSITIDSPHPDNFMRAALELTGATAARATATHP